MSPGPVIGVFALQGDVREHLSKLRSVGAQAQPVRRPEELSGVDAMVLPGGESTTMYKLATTFDLFGPLQARVAEGMPVLGTCAGMILLADSIEGGIEGQQSLGGLDVVVRRNAFGRQVDSFEADVQFADFAEPLHAVFIRAPLVEKVGAEVEVLATLHADAAEEPPATHSAGGEWPATAAHGASWSISGTWHRKDSTNPVEGAAEPGAAVAGGATTQPAVESVRTARIVAVRQGAVVATSFHPEVTADDRVHRYFVEMVRSS